MSHEIHPYKNGPSKKPVGYLDANPELYTFTASYILVVYFCWL